MSDLKLRSFFSKWGDESVSESVASSKDVGGRERLPSVGSSFDEEYGRRKGEEMTVQCKVAQVEPILGVAQQKRSFNSVINATLGVWEGILDGKLLEKQGEVSFASCGKTSSDSSKVVEGVIKCRGVKNAACINGVKEVIENVQEENGRARHEMIGGESNGSELKAEQLHMDLGCSNLHVASHVKVG